MVDETTRALANGHYQKGRILFRGFTHKDNDAAKGEFDEATKLDPDFARAYGWHAYAHLVDIQEGWTKDVNFSKARALELAIQGVDKDPGDYYTHWNLASIHAGLNDSASALKEYDVAINTSPNDPDLLADRADLHSYLGEPDEAIKKIRQAFALKIPPWYHWSLGFAYFQKGQYADAVAALEMMADPPNTAYVLLEACRAKLGEATPAEKIMERIRSKDPDWTPDHLNQFPFAKPDDRQHYINSMRAIGLAVPD